VELIVVGAGPAYTDRAGATAASYLVVSDGAALLLDLGQGSFSNLAAIRDPSSLAAVVVTHLHPDHFIDLVPLRHYLKWLCVPSRRMRVLSPAGLRDRLDAVNGSADFTSAALDVEQLAEGLIRVGPFAVEAKLVTHTDESYAVRVSVGGGPGDAAGGPGLVYSGDCGRPEDLIPLIRPGDTLLSEASFGAGPVPPGTDHLTGAMAGQAAARGGAARLLITHLLMGYDRDATLADAATAFAGPTQLVTEGDRFEV
jgi:ribonuclease BN (tRNA processing enzyme)